MTEFFKKLKLIKPDYLTSFMTLNIEKKKQTFKHKKLKLKKWMDMSD